MEIQVEALFIHQEDGRLQALNDPEGPFGPAPLFFFGQTRAGNLWRFRHDLPEALVRELDAAAVSEPGLAAQQKKPFHFETFGQILQSYRTIKRIWIGPAYQLPAGIKGSAQTVQITVKITRENVDLLQVGFAEIIPYLDWRDPCFVVVEAGRAVSICRSVRITGRAEEAGVETLAGYRGRGYAGQVVASWANSVQERGRLALYSTAWENVASQRVAMKLGARFYGLDLHFT